MADQGQEALARVLEVGRLLSSTLDLGELLRAVLELSTRVVDAETASVLLLDEKTNELYFDVALGLKGPAAAKRFKLGQGVAGSVALEGKPAVINDVKADARWSGGADQESGFVTRSILAVPLTAKGRLLGIVEAINKKTGAFSFEDLRAFEAFASQAAVAIENARLFASLQEERFKLRTVFSETADGVLLVDPVGRIQLANEAAKGLMSRASAATLDEALEGLTLTPPLADIKGGAAGERDFTAKRDLPKMLVVSGKITKLDDGAYLCVFRDDTERAQRERLKRTFLSLISHKLKTPLASITGFSDILLLELERSGVTDARLLKAARTIQGQGAKLADLVDKLLRYTHLDNPDATIRLEPCDLGAVAEEAVKEMSPWLADRGATVELSKEPGLVVVGNAEHLREVVKNLVENAAKFDPKPQKQVRVTVAASGARAELRVADTGRGIPPEDHDKVFSQFHQIEQFFTGQVDGWGLGLPFVKKVVESHGGEVALESRLGAGTTVTCRLPRKGAGA